jgi:hypothetical protein
MKIPESTLAEIRHCIHSDLCLDGGADQPDYRCTVDLPANNPHRKIGPQCTLLVSAQCSRREAFPEHLNT